MLDDRPYPAEMRDAWKSVADSLELSNYGTFQVMKIVDYVQPPLSIPALESAADIYDNDHGSRTDPTVIDRLHHSTNISILEPYRPGTYYPVYYAMINKSNLGNTGSDLYQHGRRFLSKLCHDAASGKMVSRHQFKNHVVVIRDVIIAIFQSGWRPEISNFPEKDAFLSAVRSDDMYAQKDHINKEKFELFEALLTERLQLGEITREGHGGGRGGKRDVQDVWHEQRVSALAQRTTTARATVTDLSDTPYTANHADSDPELLSLGIQPRLVGGAKREGEEASESVTLKRNSPSSQTLGDDRQLIRYCQVGSPTSSLHSVTDLSRLTPDQVNQVMETPLTPLCKVFASLLVSTGLPPARLTRLTISTDLAVVVGSTGGDQPHWLSDQNLLCYKLLDGPTLRDSDPFAQWVMLRLPPAMAACLNEHKMAPGERPLRRARDQLNSQLRRHFAITPGITPTANRLSATGWLYLRHHAIDDVAAATLSGQFGLGLSAPAAYRQLQRNENQRVFDHTLKDIGWEELASAPFPSPRVSSTSQYIDSMGSAIALPPETFITLFQQLRHAMSVPSAELLRGRSGQQFPLEALANFHQLVSAHELLAWQLSSGARPVGASSQSQLGDGMQWIHDKNSARGRESRVIPLLKNMQHSLQALHHWTLVVSHRLSNQGVPIDDQRSGERQTPAWLEMAPRGRRLILRDMYWRDLASMPDIDLHDWPTNVARHSTASWLRQRVPDAELDALLGHARHGRMLSSPLAEAPVGQQHRLRSALTTWLKACGYRPLKWEHMTWAQ